MRIFNKVFSLVNQKYRPNFNKPTLILLVDDVKSYVHSLR